MYYDEFLEQFHLVLERFHRNGRPYWRTLVVETGETNETLERMIVEDPDVEWVT